MRTDNFYKVVIIVLLVINIGTLGYLWMGGHTPGGQMPPPHGGPSNLIIERLKLDEQQQRQFEELKREHQSAIRKIRQESGMLHDSLFSLLKAEVVNDSDKYALEQRIKEVEIQKDRINFEHFKELKSILHPDQVPLYNNLVEEIGRRLTEHPPGADGRNGPPPPPDRR